MPTDFRTVPRFFIMTALPAKLGQAEVNVVDLSVRGARLQLMQPIGIGATLQFTLTTEPAAISARATVSWCRMAALALDDVECDRYLCGVMFDEEQPAVMKIVDGLLAREMAMRIEDARATERYEVTTHLTGSFGMHSPVRILDLSIRGARIGTDRPVPVGTGAALRFRVDRKHVDIYAEMVWCKPAERRNGFECGLRIQGEEALLRQVIAQLCTHNLARIDLHSLRRKFDPLQGDKQPGLLALV
ncbi:MAG TPA: PilZ domain-containing protein [Thermoanaerobaculia bacterium]|nr:PilZ domain-containing protein [Thermoanaerobaculia bacterium]